MICEQALCARQKLVSKLPITGDLLRGSLLERTIRHTKDCPKCARGVVLRLLILKHVRNWSYGVLEREARANLVFVAGYFHEPLVNLLEYLRPKLIRVASP
jgi:hypothetical protein